MLQDDCQKRRIEILYSSVYILCSILLNYSISAFSYFHLTSTLFLFSSSGSWERDRARARRRRDEVTGENTDRDKEEEQESAPEEPQHVTTAREEIGPLLAEQRKTTELKVIHSITYWTLYFFEWVVKVNWHKLQKYTSDKTSNFSFFYAIRYITSA